METSNKQAYPQLSALFEREEANIDLVEAALVIAAEHHPELDIAACHAQIEKLTNRAREHIDLKQTGSEIGQALCDFLYRESNYRGDHDDYYNPDNSYLDRVLQRRKGIPITLALVYLSVGKNLGLKIEPVGFPGHFLVKLISDENVLLDPFSGQVLSEDDCRELLKSGTGDAVPYRPELLNAVSAREVVRRILGNLKNIYLGRNELDEALRICDQLLVISKYSPRELLDRAFLLEKMDCYSAAVVDLEYLLAQMPPPQVDKVLREKISNLRGRGSNKLH